MWRWLPFASRKKQTVQETAPEPERLASVQKSLALNALVQHLREGRKYQILDLGPAVGANIEFFSRFRCRLFIEDLFDTLNSFDYLSPEDGFSYESVFSYLLPYLRSRKFDCILAWDLFNYLDRDVLAHLTEHLIRHCRRGTLLFCQIATHRHIPELPHRFRILDEETVEYVAQSSVMREAPRYETGDLTRILPGFRIMNSFFLRNGYREYLFLFE